MLSSNRLPHRKCCMLLKASHWTFWFVSLRIICQVAACERRIGSFAVTAAFEMCLLTQLACLVQWPVDVHAHETTKMCC